RGRRPAARPAAARSTRRAAHSAELGARARHGAGTVAATVAALRALRSGASLLAPSGMRARRVPRRPLLRPERPRPHARRVLREGGARPRHEIGWGPARAGGAPRVRNRRPRARRPLSPACALGGPRRSAPALRLRVG